MITSVQGIAWLNRDNVIDIALSDDGVLINHALITRILLFFGTQIIDSAITPSLFDLSSQSKVVFKPGFSGLAIGSYQVGVVTYDVSNPDGLRWGDVVIIVKQG